MKSSVISGDISTNRTDCISGNGKSLPNLVQIGSLFNIAAIGTIGRKSTFSMKNFCIFLDI